MRRLAWMGAVLALAVPMAGCGTTQKEKEKDPSGDGATQNPNVDIDTVDSLRTATVEIQRGKFQPRRVGLKSDNNLRIVNRDSETYTVEGENKSGTATFRPAKIKSGQSLKRAFSNEGDAKLTIRKTGESMTVGVFY